MLLGKKRGFYSIKLIRKFDSDDKAKDLAERARITPAYLSKIEAGKSDPSVTVAWYLATLKGLRVDDVLNLDSGVERLIKERRPLFRVPDSIKKPGVREQFAKWNEPSELKDNYYLSGNHLNRCSMLIKTTHKMAQEEILTPEYQNGGLTEFVISEPDVNGLVPELTDSQGKPIERLQLGEAFEAVIKLLDLNTNAIALKVGVSRSLVTAIETDKNEVSVGHVDQVTEVLGLTVDELIFIANPSHTKWTFFIQAGSEFQNQEMKALVTKPATLRAFRQADIPGRAEMMLDYKKWLKVEAETAEANSKLDKRFMVVSPVFQTLYL